mmetsp:Transcript_30308/g.51027  ORF Transcript_30308/g.51027 Transcript_30308/m.51027 type:complete len:366 (-) Transcript_30308:421-1518(-)|eukprot:CAMPEP_0198228204 /NCGR_PEP_ID=MMETSP1445-20131203/112277_1 /TAXON_ID=36898 /ORGANISM="Pyramimonas sp., Strain CCMP2087" /LENGTH=365 /DNA_ID=CAMNT_0043908493 /DNA_START=94 /DNA_END=1191 /DNA_ORIENTATION=+
MSPRGLARRLPIRVSLLVVLFTACIYAPNVPTCEASRAILWGDVFIPSVMSSNSGVTKPQRPSAQPQASRTSLGQTNHVEEEENEEEDSNEELDRTHNEVDRALEEQRKRGRAWMHLNQANRPKRNPRSTAPRYEWKEPDSLKNVNLVTREQNLEKVREVREDPFTVVSREQPERENSDREDSDRASHQDHTDPQDVGAGELNRLRSYIDEEVDPRVDFKSLLHEYRHHRNRADLDLHATHFALYKTAPAHKREYFKHIDQLAWAGVPKSELAAPRVEYDEDGHHVHRATVPHLEQDQVKRLPRSTRDFIRHQEKALTHPERVAQWEALNRKAATNGWLSRNERARGRGFTLNDSVTRRAITGSK